MVKNLPAVLGWGRSLEEEMETHSSILAWKIPWTEETGRLQSMESQRVGLNLSDCFFFFPKTDSPWSF